MRRISRKFPGYLIIALWKRFLDIRVYPRGYLGQGQTLLPTAIVGGNATGPIGGTNPGPLQTSMRCNGINGSPMAVGSIFHTFAAPIGSESWRDCNLSSGVDL